MSHTNHSALQLVAPMHGVLIPIEKVPDPVFAEKMVGDGVSIDPLEGVLRAPCDGEIAHIHSSGHAVTIKTVNDVEILLHIGLETVQLKGEGFTPKVKIGDTVKAGDELIHFDMKIVASKAPSLLTQIIVSTMELVLSITPSESGVVQAGDPVANIELAPTTSGSASDAEAGGNQVSSSPIPLINATGLHARPAAVLSKLAKDFESRIELVLGDKKANAKSITSIMKLNTAHGDRITLVATGNDAEEAIKTIEPELASGLGDEGCIPVTDTPIAQSKPSQPEEPATLEKTNYLTGVRASSGIVTGTIFQLKEEELNIPETGEGYEKELNRLTQAIETAKNDLSELRDKLIQSGEDAKAEIFSAHQELLGDPTLWEDVTPILESGKSAEFAWKSAYENQAKELSQLNEVLAARANDLLDVGKRVLCILLGISNEPLSFPEGSIIIAEDLTPTITANLDPKIVRGFCTKLGGPTSHVAILARALGIPAVTGIDARALDVPNGTPVILNGTEGSITLDPDPETIRKIEKIQKIVKERNARERADAHLPATTSDKKLTVEVVGNVGNPDEALSILDLGGEGVGLLRSEFLFQERTAAPTEDQQYEAYKRVIEAVGPENKVVIRTLDVGGDKPLSYLPLPKEENPFLGERGIRVSLDKPEIFRTQLRALLRASVHGNLHIMFPMIGFMDEWKIAKDMLEKERADLGVDPVPTGMMIEVPSAALLAEQFAPEVDFFSIGTNDLSQYTMAIDRGHPKLATKVDVLHPALLTLIKLTTTAAHKHGKWVGVCGGLAGDPQAVPILLGLGVDELSVSIPLIPATKALVRSFSEKHCKSLADQALASPSAPVVRKISPNPYTEEQL